MRKRWGLTLIEMIIAVALLATLTGTIIAKYNDFGKIQTATAVWNRMQQVFKEAKTNALSGKKDCAVCGGADGTCNEESDSRLLGWRVNINPGGVNGYSIEGLCNNPADPTSPFTFMQRTEVFPDNATISVITAGPIPVDVNILFKPLNGGTNRTSNLNLRVTDASGNYNSILVDTDGEVTAN